jgi:hypothetical protein
MLRRGNHCRSRARSAGNPALLQPRGWARIFCNPRADSGAGKAIDAHTSDFTLKMGGKVLGSVHRIVSADGKMRTVKNKGTHAGGKTYDDTASVPFNPGLNDN